MPDPTLSVPAPPTPAAAQQNAQTSLDTFNATAPENIKDAGRDVQASIDQFGNAAVAFESGDTMGGTAAVMRGIGSLGGVMALVAPPVGAIAAAVLGAITALIAAILEALKPQTETLEQKLKKFISEESLSNAYVAMSAGKAEWELAETKIYMLAEQRQRAAKQLAEAGDLSAAERQELEAIVAGRSWEYLTQNIGWERHKARISAAFAALAKKRDIASTEWLALYDITIVYAVRFWTAFESMAGLVGDSPDQRTAAFNNAELFMSLRRVVARQLRDDIASVHFESQNKAQLFHLWSGSSNYQEIGRRVGITGQTREETKWLGGQSTTFAVSPGGTIFSSGATDGTKPVYVGRGDAKAWVKAKGSPDCDQVFIAEIGDGKLAVVSLHGKGQKISHTMFDDREGIGEQSARDWTPNDQRWSGWSTVDLSSSPFTLLTLAIKPNPSGYILHALGYHQQRADIQLCDVQFATAQVTPLALGIQFSAAEVRDQIGGVGSLWQRSLPSGCTISYLTTGEPIVQVGGLARGLENGSLFTWPLHDYIASKAVITQARMFADETYIVVTAQGLWMRCKVDNPSTSTAWTWVRDNSLQTSWFWKQCSTQGRNPAVLYQHLEKVAKQSPT